jgi:hypothetical protein
LHDVDLEAGDVFCFGFELIWRSDQRRERAVVHRDRVFHAEKARGVGRFLRSHREIVPDWQERDIRFVKLSDQFHVAEDARVSRVIERKAARHADDQSRRLPRVD